MQIQVVGVLSPFLSFMISFQKPKVHNILCMMLDPYYKGLGLVIQFVGKERAFQITNEYDHHVLFPFLDSTYTFLNPCDANVGALNCASHNTKSTSLYDFIESNEEMVTSVMKEQLNNLWIKKVTNGECKDPLAWCRLHVI